MGLSFPEAGIGLIGYQMDSTYERLMKRILILNEKVWEERMPEPRVKAWLENFVGRVASPEVERLHALYWLAQFMYFGSREIRVLVRSLYRDLYLCPMIQEVRTSIGQSAGLAALESRVAEEIIHTRFFGVGNPSESGVHLLYYFRQENKIQKQNFLDSVQIFHRKKGGTRTLRNPAIRRYVFLDDVCGSGETAIDYSAEILEELLGLNPDAKASYYCLIASKDGLSEVRSRSLFADNVAAVYELDQTYRCASESSRYFDQRVYPEISKDIAIRLAQSYGEVLAGTPLHALGYEDSQMLLGFHHNTPDNTIPIIWHDQSHHGGARWTPAFRRYPKYVEDVQ